MVYLDLDELPSLVGQREWIGDRRYSSRAFLATDHLFGHRESLADEIHAIVEQQTGIEPSGPIRLLTQLRYMGHYFSPLNMFFVFDQDDERVEFIVAEVNNTPWNERHCYTLWDGNRTTSNELRFAHPKEFHVSPFMDMELSYRWDLSSPGNTLRVQLSNDRGSTEVFRAGMTLQRRELTKQQLNRMSLRYPLMTTQIVAAIYYQALKLWWKKCPFYKHPKKLVQASIVADATGQQPIQRPTKERHTTYRR